MCLVAVAWRTHARFPLALIANRDELHARPAAPAGFDPEHADVYGGRDLRAGGSWLLASTRGRLAAVTNVRSGRHPEAAPRSRGALVRDFAAGTLGAGEFARELAVTAPEYGRFNLLLWDGDALAFATNHPDVETRAVEPGLHAMSNGAFDAPWPKSAHATRALEAWLRSPLAEGDIGELRIDGALAPLFDALSDATPAPDATLPDTGVGLALERALSPPFVRDATYGTRCSTVVLAGAEGIVFAERRFGPDAQREGESRSVLPRAEPFRMGRRGQ